MYLRNKGPLCSSLFFLAVFFGFRSVGTLAMTPSQEFTRERRIRGIKRNQGLQTFEHCNVGDSWGSWRLCPMRTSTLPFPPQAKGSRSNNVLSTFNLRRVIAVDVLTSQRLSISYVRIRFSNMRYGLWQRAHYFRLHVISTQVQSQQDSSYLISYQEHYASRNLSLPRIAHISTYSPHSPQPRIPCVPATYPAIPLHIPLSRCPAFPHGSVLSESRLL
ncbi:hypothetical protein C8R42DRAFT_241914 [Lentinula raphanica]|nr:hypothetical protein C8R42DRAFT_241914 [Lentinula raphanica]